MNFHDPVKIVEWLVWYANQRESNLTPVRIVKFLYLLDLYYARQTGGKTLTGWTWKFVHYGPFCGEALEAISQAEAAGLIASMTFTSKFDKDGKTYRHSAEDEPAELPDLLPTYVCSEIKHAVELWSDDTYGLLNHVYFNTEPMASAVPQQVLDFSTAKMPIRERPIELNRFSNKKLKKAKELLQKLRSAHQEQSNARKRLAGAGIRDESYFLALQSLEKEAENPPVFSGILDLTS